MSSPKVKVGSLGIFFLGALSLLFSSLVGGQRDSNARHSRWQRDALPLSYARTLIFHPHRFMLPPFGGEPNRCGSVLHIAGVVQSEEALRLFLIRQSHASGRFGAKIDPYA